MPGCPRPRSIAWLAVLVCLTATGSASTQDGPTVHDMLAHDGLDSPAACAHVDFDDSLRSNASIESLRAQPPNPSGVTPAEFSLYVLAIDRLEPQTNSFEMEGYAGMVWCDPRLAFDPAEVGSDRKLYEGAAAESRLEQIWWPGVFLPTGLGEGERSVPLLMVHADGTVRFTIKTHTRQIAHFDFRDYPLDRQHLQIEIQANRNTSETLQLLVDTERTGFDPEFEIPEWQILRATERVDEARGFSRVVIEFELGRRLGFYIWKVGLPLLLIMCVCWSVFWLTRDVLAQRQRQAATGVLTLVAYQFVATDSVPRVSYLTLLDALFLWTFVAAASTLWLNVRSARAFRRDQQSGLRMDRRWRVLYPLLYLAGVALILFWRLVVRPWD